MTVSSRLYLDPTTLPGVSSGQRLEFINKLPKHVGGIRRFARLVRELHPVRCQTCHEKLETVSEICFDQIFPIDEIILTLHHPTCRGSEESYGRNGTIAGAPTAAATAVLLPDRVLPMESRPTVAIVVNPSCERVIARQLGVWKRVRNTALTDLHDYGFAASSRRAVELTATSAKLTGEQLTIDVPTVHQPYPSDYVYSGGVRRMWARTAYGEPLPALAQTWTVDDLSDDVRAALEDSSHAVLVVTTRYLPTQLNPANLRQTLALPGALVGKLRIEARSTGDRQPNVAEATR